MITLKPKKPPKVAIQKLKALKRKSRSIEVGLLNNAPNYPDGTRVVLVGAVHEYGAPDQNIPARKWLSKSIKADTRFYKNELVKTLRADRRAEAALLERLGQIAVDHVRGHVDKNDIGMEPEAKSTQTRKGGSSPMIDTGHMIKIALDYNIS